MPSVHSLGILLFPELCLSRLIICTIGIVPMVPVLTCWTPGLLPAFHFTQPNFSSMTCHSGKASLYGVIKVYLRYGIVDLRTRLIALSTPLSQGKGYLLRPLNHLNQFKSLLLHRKLHGKLGLIRCQARFKYPTQNQCSLRVLACSCVYKHLCYCVSAHECFCVFQTKKTRGVK